MEALLIASFITQYDTIKENFERMEPFLNINENAGRQYYGFIICLKTAFVFYSIERTMPKWFSIIAVLISSLSAVNVFLSVPIYFYVNIILHLLSFYSPSMLLVGFASLSYKPCELSLDILVLLCALYYLINTYTKNIDKLSTISLMGLYTHWYVNSLTSTQFSLSDYWNIVSVILLSFLPLLPNNPKHRHRILIFYTVLILWVFYKSDEHNRNQIVSQTKNKYLCMENQNGFDNQKCGLNITLENLEENNLVEILNLKDSDNLNTLYRVESLNKHLPKTVLTKYINLVKDECFDQYMICTDMSKKKKTEVVENVDTESKESIKYTAFPHEGKTETVNKRTIDTESRSTTIEKKGHESTEDGKTELVKQEESNDSKEVKTEEYKTNREKERESESTELSSTNAKNLDKSHLGADETGEITHLKGTEDISKTMSKPKAISRVATRFPKLIATGKVPILSRLSGTGKYSKRHHGMFGTSKFAVKLPGVVGTSRVTGKFPGVAGTSRVTEKFPGVTGTSRVTGKFSGVTGSSKVARKFSGVIGTQKVVADKLDGMTEANKVAGIQPGGIEDVNKSGRSFGVKGDINVPGTTIKEKVTENLPGLIGTSNVKKQEYGARENNAVENSRSNGNEINAFAMGDLQEPTIKTSTFKSKDEVQVTNEVTKNDFETNIASRLEKHDKTTTTEHAQFRSKSESNKHDGKSR